MPFEEDVNLAALIGSDDDNLGAIDTLRAKEDTFTLWGACGAIRRDIFLSK
ncbi:hypothetical protein IQ226_18610 [Dolichospermum sp. LEGE 00240]|uniref:hypothetical protein n=1 Tax=Dolichospermum sp. LEGE 00240 TaxID=1828603 RepID=UPI0018823FBE|nr:hypothetical protein [Dolichospermum sp. LEGE 00240]MDM3848333.1 hypothetical protein [Aphanizomenon gracile PMC638.10]MDM3849379.1 hypothetical protein [Aphanizomenon gracile PMC627.10]MDM3853457.1 hypothetical protein [Aphanizomenon gracile PMC649.10]MDM3862624.1 hypothetical protein [Aphanizomenon gracile PMC644.10]MBE9251105.1 hypothetical protein [Dolichospermum sp. LEGE 00240]